jgi:hypothetical protein
MMPNLNPARCQRVIGSITTLPLDRPGIVSQSKAVKLTRRAQAHEHATRLPSRSPQGGTR